MKNSIMKNKLTLPYIKHLIIAITVLTVLLIWDVSAKIIDENIIIPSVRETADSLYKIIVSADFVKLIFTAFFRLLIGLLLGIISGVFLAIICHKFDILATIISPFISILKATPVACIIVILWISFTISQVTILVSIMMVLPIVWQNVYDGLDSIDENLIEVASVFKLSTWQKLIVLYIPSTLSYLMPAVITSIGLAWKAEIATEIMTYNNIGYMIRDYKTFLDAASIFAWTIIIVALSILFEKGAKYLLGRLGNALKAE